MLATVTGRRAKSLLHVKRWIRKGGKADSALLLPDMYKDPEGLVAGWSVGIKRQPAHCVSGGGEGIGKTRRAAREQTQPPRAHEDLLEYPLRVKGSVCLPLSFCLTRANVVIKPPAPQCRFPLSALVNRITLWKENQFPRGRKGESDWRKVHIHQRLDLTFFVPLSIFEWCFSEELMELRNDEERRGKWLLIWRISRGLLVIGSPVFREGDNLWINFRIFGYSAESRYRSSHRKLITHVDRDKVTAMVAINQKMLSDQLCYSLIVLRFMAVQ